MGTGKKHIIDTRLRLTLKSDKWTEALTKERYNCLFSKELKA